MYQLPNEPTTDATIQPPTLCEGTGKIFCLFCFVTMFCIAGCFIDFTESIPCTSQEQCPTDFSCDLQTNLCVEGDRSSTDLDVGVDISQDVEDDLLDAGTSGETSGETSGTTGSTSTGGTSPFEGPCPTDMAFVEDEGFCIDLYEASRPDATEFSAGFDDSFARSLEGVLPWTNVVPTAARQACESVGKRLCTAQEWETGCGGGEFTYPYSVEIFDRSLCNMSGSVDVTGSVASCVYAPLGTVDMSGNVAELIDAPDNGVLVRGGSYVDTTGGQVSCDAAPRSISPGRSVGFRCCRDASEE